MLGPESAHLLQRVVHLLGDMYLLGLAGALHARGRVHRVAEEAVARHLGAHYAGDHRTRVDSAPDLDELVSRPGDPEERRGVQQIKRHCCYLADVLVPCGGSGLESSMA